MKQGWRESDWCTHSSIHDFFSDIKTEKQAYWTGMILADGCVSETRERPTRIDLKLKGSDHKHLVKFKNDIGTTAKVKDHTTKIGHKSSGVCVF